MNDRELSEAEEEHTRRDYTRPIVLTVIFLGSVAFWACTFIAIWMACND